MKPVLTQSRLSVPVMSYAHSATLTQLRALQHQNGDIETDGAGSHARRKQFSPTLPARQRFESKGKFTSDRLEQSPLLKSI